mmetsp:Transcript_35534/g.83862  ORF Transcript_35534/g.83862 Transcript_35534/m.83862 type:complete len:226 (+) Transcript_35534:1946-2623(+)
MITMIAVFFPLTKVLSVSPRSSFRCPSCVRLSTNEIAAAVSSTATLRWLAPSHSAGNEASVSIERQRMSAQDSTKRSWTKHPTTGTARVVEVREPRGACTGTRAGSQVSEPSIRMLACSPDCGSPSDFAIIIAMPTNGFACEHLNCASKHTSRAALRSTGPWPPPSRPSSSEQPRAELVAVGWNVPCAKWYAARWNAWNASIDAVVDGKLVLMRPVRAECSDGMM